MRKRRDVFGSVKNEPTSVAPTTIDPRIGADIRIDGLRVESSDRQANYDDDGVPELMSATPVRFRFFGAGFSTRTVVTLTEVKNNHGGSCILPASGQFRVQENSVQPHTMVVEMLVPRGKSSYYFCTKNLEEDNATSEVSACV